VDHDRGVQLPGWLDPAAGRRDAVPPLTAEVQHGRFVKMDDSWQAGIDGAQPGIIMPGNPPPGDQYRQEYYPHHALGH
jgi:hypothetical protein